MICHRYLDWILILLITSLVLLNRAWVLNNCLLKIFNLFLFIIWVYAKIWKKMIFNFVFLVNFIYFHVKSKYLKCFIMLFAILPSFLVLRVSVASWICWFKIYLFLYFLVFFGKSPFFFSPKIIAYWYSQWI